MHPNIRFADIGDFLKYREFDPHSMYIDPKKIDHKIKQDEIIIATNDDKIVGLIRLGFIWSTRPYMEYIYVDEQFREKGIGKALLAFLEDYLKKNQYGYLFSSSEEDEKAAREWHKKNGFKEIGKLPKINLPFDETSEVFFIKKISDYKDLKEYPI